MNKLSERFYGLDHLRAVAILLVLLYHYRAFGHPSWVDEYGRFGWTGVDLFFVLSGFLISNILFKEIKEHNAINLKVFFIKRFFRIIPPYLFTLFLYFYFIGFREREALPPLWKFITFTQNFGLDVIHEGTFSHAWSLCIEEQFYLVLPVILLILTRSKRLDCLKYITLCIILFALLCRLISWEKYIIPNLSTDHFWLEWYMKIYYPTYTRLDGLATGVIIGYLYQYSDNFRKFIFKYGNALLILGLFSLGFTFWVCNEQTSRNASIFGFTLVALSYGLIVASAISPTSLLQKNRVNISAQLANLSYAIYLSHKGIIHFTQSFLEIVHIQISGNAALFICLFTCISTGLFYQYLIENPSSKMKNYFLKILR
ncbi:acyltransferase [Chryseobacterium sp. Alg-005]|uniref:acyltransferase family protein n=1 Tax=Chryseobacterium sp. Alg-005 TaxID=3159516 RepID=UPI003555BC97